MVRTEKENKFKSNNFLSRNKNFRKNFLMDDDIFVMPLPSRESIPCFSSRCDILENYSDYGGRHLLSGRRDIIMRRIVGDGGDDICDISPVQYFTN